MLFIDIKQEIIDISQLISYGDFKQAYIRTNNILLRINKLMKNKQYYDYLFNISGLFVDIGHMGKISDSTATGIRILEENRDYFEKNKNNSFYYFYANALSNILKEEKESLCFVNFQNINILNNAKKMYWKAIKSVQSQDKTIPNEYLVNLANSLKSQYRLVEAIQYYDQVNKSSDIPQAWINKSEALIMLNNMTSSLSINMLEEIKTGFLYASKSKEVPKIWHEYYEYRANSISQQINKLREENNETEIEDKEQTQFEYNSHSNYRKWCLDNHMSLTEHGLYCKCIASSKDNLTIFENTIGNQTIVSMELVLNRLKSEFGFARHLYYEYLHNNQWTEADTEQGFSQLFNDEILGLNIERIRMAFRICFGILDKIGVAIFDLLNLEKQKHEMIYFHSFWDKTPERIIFFQNIKNNGLVALYSIANDLNPSKMHKGELSFYKKWRNLLEHDFMIIHKNNFPEDLYGSYQGFKKQIEFVNEHEFLESLTHVLQLTRSAIFSFVFAVREYAKQNSPNENQISGTLEVLKKETYL